jgi:hypothetical protein
MSTGVGEVQCTLGGCPPNKVPNIYQHKQPEVEKKILTINRIKNEREKFRD